MNMGYIQIRKGRGYVCETYWACARKELGASENLYLSEQNTAQKSKWTST